MTFVYFLNTYCSRRCIISITFSGLVIIKAFSGETKNVIRGTITGKNNTDVLFQSTSGVLLLILHVSLGESECHGYRAKRGSSTQGFYERREI